MPINATQNTLLLVYTMYLYGVASAIIKSKYSTILKNHDDVLCSVVANTQWTCSCHVVCPAVVNTQWTCSYHAICPAVANTQWTCLYHAVCMSCTSKYSMNMSISCFMSCSSKYSMNMSISCLMPCSSKYSMNIPVSLEYPFVFILNVFKKSLILFAVCECFARMYVCAPCVLRRPWRSKKGITWNWSYPQHHRVLRSKPRSSARSTRVILTAETSLWSCFIFNKR